MTLEKDLRGGCDTTEISNFGNLHSTKQQGYTHTGGTHGHVSAVREPFMAGKKSRRVRFWNRIEERLVRLGKYCDKAPRCFKEV
jgi:hypothetical protein